MMAKNIFGKAMNFYSVFFSRRKISILESSRYLVVISSSLPIHTQSDTTIGEIGRVGGVYLS